MRIRNGKALSKLEMKERENIGYYHDSLEEWTYKYIHDGNRALLARMQVVHEKGREKLRSEVISPDEIGVLALACRYYKPGFVENNTIAEKEFAEYQFKLQSYLGITKPEFLGDFYRDLISNLKLEHKKLIPILYTHQTQIHALKIAYDALKGSIGSANMTTRVIFGLICIEFMKLQVRLYLVEPLARTEEGKNLDWVGVLDKVFNDFKGSKANGESIRRKNVVAINHYNELGLEQALEQIRHVRDQVDDAKRKKRGVPNERIEKPIKANPRNYLSIVQGVKGKMKGI